MDLCQPVELRPDAHRRLVPRGASGLRGIVSVVAVIVAINLGLLGPLCCVIHCALRSLIVERPAISYFLCGEHGKTSAQAASDNRPAPPSPRALYEALTRTALLIGPLSLLIAVLATPPRHRRASFALAPPTPPPRLFGI